MSDELTPDQFSDFVQSFKEDPTMDPEIIEAWMQLCTTHQFNEVIGVGRNFLRPAGKSPFFPADVLTVPA